MRAGHDRRLRFVHVVEALESRKLLSGSSTLMMPPATGGARPSGVTSTPTQPAQSVGSVSGAVTDSKGAALANAQIILIPTDGSEGGSGGGSSTSATTSASGLPIAVDPPPRL